MNINEAKQEIIHTLQAYHQKDEYGNYRYPLVRQRPILLMGPPGIGKTAIMEQIAQEEGVGLVSYTITHHTRQSAIGLPHIETRSYQGKELQVTEYTLSEIIASVYECMEHTGHEEGILFIDEINCVSETLAPTMLQFLQNKTFGSHKVPEGFMIVAAGNPPEYNKSVREFDVVTLDRVRRIDISADVQTWLDYAWNRGIHGAILSYLGVRQEHFYLIENTVDGQSFVTARGWEDLSQILKSYEELKIPIGLPLIVQYLQKEEIARDFAAYYALYQKYGMDYGVLEMLSGSLSKAALKTRASMAAEASFEERFTVVNLVLDALNGDFVRYQEMDSNITALHEALKYLKNHLYGARGTLGDFIEARQNSLKVKEEAELIKAGERRKERWLIHKLQDYRLQVKKEHLRDEKILFSRIEELFAADLRERSRLIEEIQQKLQRAFDFLGECFGDEQEMILFTTGLTRNMRAMDYISLHGCPSYFKYSSSLLYHRREEELRAACLDLL